MRWAKDKRPSYPKGGYWRCPVKHNAWDRARYDRDPIFRISKRLHDDAYQRGLSLKRMEDRLGPLPD